ncbi:MAG: hypothetical protein R2762_21885 [Bryobacteraceae bacterium]
MSKRNKARFSLARMKAAWINGAKSPGPSTPNAKNKIACNALKHGLTAKTVLLPGENPDLLRTLADSYLAIHQPADDAEFLLVEEMVAAKWKLRRSWSTENSLLQDEMGSQSSKIAAEFEDPKADLIHAKAFRELADTSKSLALVYRQQARYAREHDRALDQLRFTQTLRKEREADAATIDPSTRAVENGHTPMNPPQCAGNNSNQTNGEEIESRKTQNNPKPSDIYPPVGVQAPADDGPQPALAMDE